MSLTSCLVCPHFHYFLFLASFSPAISLNPLQFVILPLAHSMLSSLAFFSFWFALFPFCLTYLVIWPANRLNRFDCATMQSCTLLDQPSNNRFMWFAQWVETKKDRIWQVLVRQKNNMSSTCRCCKCWAVTLAGSAFVPFWLKMDRLLLIPRLSPLRREMHCHWRAS